jgi:hypothetical protein
MEHQHSTAGMANFLGRDLNTKPVNQACDRPAWFLERGGAHNPPGPLIGYTQYDPAAAFVGQRRAVLCQSLKVKVCLGFLELQVFRFRLGQPSIKFLKSRHHAWVSPRLRISRRLYFSKDLVNLFHWPNTKWRELPGFVPPSPDSST